MQKQGFRIGWVANSYFMIAGGLVAVSALWQAMNLQSEVGAYAMCFLGAAIGGFFAGRASEGKTIAEPAVGALLVVASFILLISLVAGFRVLVALKSEKILTPLLGLSAAMAVGGLVGATLGEKTSTEPRSESKIRWAGVASLIMLGQFFMLIIVGAVLMFRSKGVGMTADDGAALALVTLALSAFFGGFATQAVAPRRMAWACGWGFLLAMLPIGIAGAAKGDSSAMLGTLILGGVGILLGAGGARLGWALIGKRYQQSTETIASTFD